MAGFGTSFDPNTTPDTGNGGGGLHPAGIFEFEITESDVKATSSGTGTLMSFTAVGTGHGDAPEDNKGHKCWGNINVTNGNAQAQAIGQAQLAALAAACGLNIGDLQDTEQLHYRPFWAEVVHKPRMGKGPSGKYDQPQFNDDGSPKMQAEFKRFMFDGMEELAKSAPPASKPAAQTPPPAQAAQAAAGGARRPWASK